MCVEREIWLTYACRYLGTMPGMKPGQVLGHEVRLLRETSHVHSTHRRCYRQGVSSNMDLDLWPVAYTTPCVAYEGVGVRAEAHDVCAPSANGAVAA